MNSYKYTKIQLSIRLILLDEVIIEVLYIFYLVSHFQLLNLDIDPETLL